MKGNVIPTRKLASQFNIPEKLIAGGLGPCLNNSPPRNKGIGPRNESSVNIFEIDRIRRIVCAGRKTFNVKIYKNITIL